MSSSDRIRTGARAPFARPSWLRAALSAGLVLALGLAAGCTARPLYGDLAPASGQQGPRSAQLASVDVLPAPDRVGQEVRNHLIFLFGGGQGQPASPQWRLKVATSVAKSVPATVTVGARSLEPTSGLITVTGSYSLTEAATGKQVASGRRSVQSPYDIPAQDFAAARAERDAENRAARELAELLRIVVAQELARR
jgi:LPS-assembly lipoprotein